MYNNMKLFQLAHCNFRFFKLTYLITHGLIFLKAQVIVVQVVEVQLRDVELVDIEVPVEIVEVSVAIVVELKLPSSRRQFKLTR
jgi:hypothetical protein